MCEQTHVFSPMQTFTLFRKKVIFCTEAHTLFTELNAFCTGLLIEGSHVLVLKTRTDIWQILVHCHDQYV